MTSIDPLVMAQLKQDCFGRSQALCILIYLSDVCLFHLFPTVEMLVVDVVESNAL
jgi:hypothetical protein